MLNEHPTLRDFIQSLSLTRYQRKKLEDLIQEALDLEREIGDDKGYAKGVMDSGRVY